jgi:effector-binding domain-containing protein
MLTEPGIKVRAEEPYAAKIITVARSEIAARATPLIQEVMEWVKASGGAFAGPPFFNYFEFLAGGRMKMAVGRATTKVLDGNSGVTTGSLPAGRYASVTHTGPYQELYAANMALDNWIKAKGLALAGEPHDGGVIGATRLEIYHDPGIGKPPVTEVAFRLKD